MDWPEREVPPSFRNIECPTCNMLVQARVLSEREVSDEETHQTIHRISFVQCFACGLLLLTREEPRGFDQNGNVDDWRRPVRVWPKPARETHGAIPAIVQVSLDEADVCHRAGAHTACAVMCGRALEGICVHFGINEVLVKGLRDLRAQGKIDDRLLEWGEALRLVRNTAAHASGQKVSREDSTDLLHFLTAICEYVFVLTARFDAFKQRRANQSGGPAPAAPPPQQVKAQP